MQTGPRACSPASWRAPGLFARPPQVARRAGKLRPMTVPVLHLVAEQVSREAFERAAADGTQHLARCGIRKVPTRPLPERFSICGKCYLCEVAGRVVE